MTVASEHENHNFDKQELTRRLRTNSGQQFLQQIIDNSYDSIFVTDKFGNVLLANSGPEKFMGFNKPEELVGNNVQNLVKSGSYDWSPTLEAIKTRLVVSGIVTNRYGDKEIVTSKPLIDENGEIVMVITNARDVDLVESYRAALEKERTAVHRYKTAVKYLSEVDSGNKELVAESPQMRQVVKTSKAIAQTDSTVILTGETGTGKEVMARYIHRNSLRSKEPFIPVNCAAIPYDLLESEFFGYVRGAFSGANPHGKPGLFEIADKGTLFLDEIAELPLTMQSKLLRVLESSEVQRLGDTNIYRADVRFIAATNRDLKAMMVQKQFRSDLYYRLNVIPINLPALRDRPEDILAFAHKFLQELNQKYGLKKQFSAQATEILFNYNWPGNVRELHNVIERLVITFPGNIVNLEVDSLVNHKIRKDNTQNYPVLTHPYHGTLKSVIKSVEKEYINQVLAKCGGRIGEASRKLGIHRTMLYRKLNGSQKEK